MSTKPLTCAVILSALLAGICLPGCPLISWPVAIFAPPRKIQALYHPPRDKKYLVFVDELRQEVIYEPVRERLTRRLNRQLIANKIAAEVVPYEEMLRLIATTPRFNSLHVPTVGRRLGADVVLYVEIRKFSVRDDGSGPLWRGQLEVSVKVVDSLTGRLWPEDREDGHPVKPVETPLTENTSSTYGQELTRVLADMMADRVAKLFYDHSEPVHNPGG